MDKSNFDADFPEDPLASTRNGVFSVADHDIPSRLAELTGNIDSNRESVNG